ncbi:MAG: tRNA (adenosine(37)-N6)-dimethylallyltransferase MiaA [Spirochaetales bacterium]|nr:tRNA (adenosine(37)-N6)-dimethylallyltransferase MiaA [Candidatus Physcosoma equi]
MKAERRKITKPKAVVLFGPTAVGKTALTEHLFSKGFEIINADSVQVYRHLDIASAKPEKELQEKIPHHLVDVRDPWEQYTSGDFCNDADRLIPLINERGHVPLITGGTAYYFKQLCYGKAETPASDPLIREQVKREIEEKGKEWAKEKLTKVDPQSASRINTNDLYRLSRALEVYYQTGRPLSSFEVSEDLRDDVDFVLIGLTRPKEELQERIRLRVDIMFRDGAWDEMKKLFSMGADSSWPGMQGIGYKEFLTARDSGEANLSSIKAEIVRNSVLYAKRQMTFFNSFRGVKWFDPRSEEGIKAYLEERGILIP